MKLMSFGYYDFDLAVHALSVWNILHGSIYNSILGIPFLGNHVHIILFFIAPIYAIFNHPFTLLILQVLALGLAVLPLYGLSKRLLDKNWALLISIIYLFYPALGYTNLFEFHPTVFATLFLILTFYYYIQNSFLKFIIFVLLSMICQENISFGIIMFGFLAILEHKKLKWIITPILLGSLYFAIALLVMSHFNNNTIEFINLYRHLGDSVPRIILNLITKPALLFKTLIRKDNFLFLLHLFLPLSFLPFLAPAKLIPALLFFLQHLFSRRAAELTIYFHYSAELIPFIFISFIFGIKYLLGKSKFINSRQMIFKISLISILLVSNLYLGPHFRMLNSLRYEYKRDYSDEYKDALLAKIPKNASLVSTFEFLPYLSNRRNLFSLHHVYMGYYTLSSKKYELPKDVEYALIDFNDFLTFWGFYGIHNYKNLQRLLVDGHWKVVDVLDSIVLFKKDVHSKQDLFQIIRAVPRDLKHKIRINIENDIELIGYDIGSKNKQGILGLTFFWKCLRSTDKDINIFLDIVDNRNIIIMRKMLPICYRIFPVNSWQKGEIYKEKLFLRLPVSLKEHYILKMVFFDRRNNLLCKVNGSTDERGRVSIMEIN
jgi:uncharacterized membrane protein